MYIQNTDLTKLRSKNFPPMQIPLMKVPPFPTAAMVFGGKARESTVPHSDLPRLNSGKC